MNLQENIDRIKEVMGLISELDIKKKNPVEGSYKNVYMSPNNPDIIYKFAEYADLMGEKVLFDEFPDLFSIPIGDIKKSNETVTHRKPNGETYVNNYHYLAFEKLDTKKFEDFYSTMQEVFNTYATDEIKKLWETHRYSNKIDYFFSIIFEMATNLNKGEVVDVFHTMNPIVQREAPQYYNDYLQFIDLLYKITTLDYYDSDAYWDFNSGNFGYDKNGKIKSLDI